MIDISPSIASADLLHLREEIEFVDSHFEKIHIDIEDGVYLPNISFGFKLARAVCQASVSHKSLHIMTQDPLRWLPDIANCRAEIVFIHIDHLKDPVLTLEKFLASGITVGLGVSNRDIGRDLTPLLKRVSSALVLTAEIEDPLQKYSPALAQFAGKLAETFHKEVWVDGGVTDTALPELAAMGIHTAVMGRAVFQNKNRFLSGHT